jgi:prepilin-type N-terminal cleavage/methylation domain-containing protein
MPKIEGDLQMSRNAEHLKRIVSDKKGFTLVEVMIAMFCFLIAMLALTGLSSGTWHGLTHSKMTTEASVLGSKILENLRGISQNYNSADIADDTVYTLEEDGYTVSYRIMNNAVLPNTKYVRMDVNYSLKGASKTVRMYYLLPQVI